MVLNLILYEIFDNWLCISFHRWLYKTYKSNLCRCHNFRIKSVGFSKTTAGANIKLYNPNHYNLEIKQADADVYLNEKYFGHAFFRYSYSSA